MQGSRVRSLVGELDPTCAAKHATTKILCSQNKLINTLKKKKKPDSMPQLGTTQKAIPLQFPCRMDWGPAATTSTSPCAFPASSLPYKCCPRELFPETSYLGCKSLPQSLFPRKPYVSKMWMLCVFIIYLFIYLFICLFLAVLGLRCCAWAFSSCGEQGLLFVAVHVFLIAVASLVAEHRL